jgi:hypothetical protein
MFFSKRKKPQSQPEPVLRADINDQDLIQAFRKKISLRIKPDALDQTDFAMWIACSSDPSFHDSQIRRLWSEIYRSSAGCRSYMAADLLRALHFPGSDPRVKLPDELDAFAFISDDGFQGVLSLSAEKGIRFHFPDAAPYSGRLDFLKSFSSYCRAWKKFVTSNKWQEDKSSSPEEWWLKVSSAAEAEERKSALLVGRIIV